MNVYWNYTKQAICHKPVIMRHAQSHKGKHKKWTALTAGHNLKVTKTQKQITTPSMCHMYKNNTQRTTTCNSSVSYTIPTLTPKSFTFRLGPLLFLPASCPGSCGADIDEPIT